MSKYLIESIYKNNRHNIKYIYPVASNDILCQWISAFSNSAGGYIVLGVSDDGKKLKVKSFNFKLNERRILAKLSENAIVEFGEMKYNEMLLSYIKILRADNLVTCDGIAYIIRGPKMRVEKICIKKLFLSYCHADKCIADIIDERLNELAKGRISITRDTRTIDYKGNIEEFMQTIAQHDFAISIVSDRYLKSRGCMYEISELMRDRKYFDKLLFVILSDSDIKHYDGRAKIEDVKADIYSLDRFKYIKYWELEKAKIDKLDAEIADIALKQGIVEEAKQIAVISSNTAEFLERLKNSLGKGFEEMLLNDFKDFLTIVLS